MVDFPGVLPENSVYQIDRKDGMGVRVVVALLQLMGVKLAAIKDDPLKQACENRELHFDVVDGTRLIDGLNIENR